MMAMPQCKLTVSDILLGGSVDLKTDSNHGIAFITINNPSKKNAFTGMTLSLH